MTNHWVDIKNADLVLIMGGNAAEAHPCGFKWVIEAKKERKAKLITVDPRFTRSAAVSDFYAPVRAGRHRFPWRRHQLPADQRQDPP
jgi:formate dehydrogenase major subunit